MKARLSFLLPLLALLATQAIAKDKKKSTLPDYVLRAETVRVVIDPDAGEPLDHPTANATARDNVERALEVWGRFKPVLDGQESDLVVVVRTGNDKAVEPTIRGGPIDQRAGVGQSTDSGIRIGGQHGQPPPLTDPSTDPQQNRGPHISNEVGLTKDSFAVYRGNVVNPLDSSPVWRYVAKDCLQAPYVAAVEEFRKAIAQAEKPQQPKKP
jgi:hypothetical protein